MLNRNDTNQTDSSEYIIRKSRPEDFLQIFSLYQLVSKTPGGLARTGSEITEGYVKNFTEKSIENGVQFVIVSQRTNVIIGEIHCYKLEPSVFKHVLSELTISIADAYQGKGLGRKLFEALLNVVLISRGDILRIELIARESNVKAIQLYESLGFVKEGRLENRIHVRGKIFEADIPMAWLNPNFTDS
jgi:RimJ/RimL family protein N-acetyltransferase